MSAYPLASWKRLCFMESVKGTRALVFESMWVCMYDNCILIFVDEKN